MKKRSLKKRASTNIKKSSSPSGKYTTKKKVKSARAVSTIKGLRSGAIAVTTPKRLPRILPKINARVGGWPERQVISEVITLNAASNILQWVNETSPEDIKALTYLISSGALNAKDLNGLLRTSSKISGFIQHVLKLKGPSRSNLVKFDAEVVGFIQQNDGFCEKFDICKYLDVSNHTKKIDESILEFLARLSGPFYGFTEKAYDEKSLLGWISGVIYHEKIFATFAGLDPMVAVILLMALFSLYGAWEVCECFKKASKKSSEKKSKTKAKKKK